MSIYTVLRLKCDGCGRNLADVRRNLEAHHSHGVRVLLTVRRGVDLRVYLPPQTPERVVMRNWASDEGVLDLTSYSFRCRCGRQHDKRKALIGTYWRDHAQPGYVRVVYATLGTDL